MNTKSEKKDDIVKPMFQSLDKNGIVLDVNQEWLDEMQYRREEVIGKHFGDFIADGKLETLKENFPHLRDYGFVNNVIFRLKRKDGVFIEVVLNGTSVYDNIGNFVRTKCELRNIEFFVRCTDSITRILAHERFLKGYIYTKSRINQLIVKSDTQKDFLKNICDILIEPLEIVHCSLLIPDNQKLKTVSSAGELDNKSVECIINNPGLPDAKKCRTIVIEHIDNTYFPDLAAVVFLPMNCTQNMDITGGLALVFKTFNRFRDEWISELEGIASLIDFGLKSLQIKEEKEGLLKELAQSNRELRQALEQVKTLRGLLPICTSCKKIRDDTGYWQQLENYIQAHTEAVFSHGICEDCQEKIYGNDEWYRNYKARRDDETSG